MSDADDSKSPLDALIELGLYAPLGLVLEARDRLPELIERGHQQVTSLTTLYRMMGDYSVRQAEKDWRKRWDELQTTLKGLGLLPDPAPSRSAPASASAGTAPTPPPETVVPSDLSSSTSASTNGSASTKGSTNGKAAEEPAVRARADLAIPGYDTLSASQVVQRLAGLSPDELEAVRDYESGTRGRRTILSKIASLQSDPSS